MHLQRLEFLALTKTSNRDLPFTPAPKRQQENPKTNAKIAQREKNRE